MTTSKIRGFLAVVFGLFLAAVVRGEPADTVVSIVNFYPGPEIYELEGHTALRIRMPGTDVAVSYGTYDFNQPNFVYRFVKGETDYWVTTMPWNYVERSYAGCGRRIVEHVLDLDSVQKKRLIDLIGQNLKPENRTYRYNYVKDNCATRPLRMVELALGDTIVLGEAGGEFAGMQTFRSIMRRCHRNYPWYQFGIDLALGSGIDYRIDLREKAFAPVVLDSQLRGAAVAGHALVKDTIVLNDVPGDSGVLDPTPWILSPITVSGILLLLILVLTVRDIRRGSVTRWVDAVLFGVFGLAGLLLTFLVFVSVHEATSPNMLLLWLNPLCFVPTIFIWINRCKVINLSYQIVNFVALIVLAIIWPVQSQSGNVAFIPLVLCDAIRSASYIYLTVKKK